MKQYQIRLHAIALADDDGSNAAAMTAGKLTSMLGAINQVYAAAGLKFVFDEATDFTQMNSTLHNSEFTILEPPNLGDGKWDHNPAVDKASHKQARTELAKQFPAKLVVIFHHRQQFVQTEVEPKYWKLDGLGGSSSGEAHYVGMPGTCSANDLAHEMEHYLDVMHPHVKGITTVELAAGKIKKYVEGGHPKDEGLDVLDGDRYWVLDTPADCGQGIFTNAGLNPCGEVGEVPIPVTFSDGSSQTYTLAPDRSLVVGYFKNCPGPKTLSPQQARRVRDSLELRRRHVLISVKSSLSYNVVRGATEVSSSVAELDIALVRAGRIATAARGSTGNLGVVVWDIEEGGAKIVQRGSGSAGRVGAIAACGCGLNMLATAVGDGAGELKVIAWRVDEGGKVTRLDSAKQSGQIKRVAVAHVTLNYIATASWLADGTLRVDIWRVDADGKVSLQNTAAAEKIDFLGQVCSIGAWSFVTCVSKGGGMLTPILWQYLRGDNVLTRLGSGPERGTHVKNLAACTVERELALIAYRDSESFTLKLASFRSPDDGLSLQPQGREEAEAVSDIGVCRLGTEMAVTGVKDKEGRLRVMLWQVKKGSSPIVRLHDAATDETFDRLAMCYTDRDEFVTALRDGQGNLRIIAWRLGRATTAPSLATGGDISNSTLVAAPAQADPARGLECDAEDP